MALMSFTSIISYTDTSTLAFDEDVLEIDPTDGVRLKDLGGGTYTPDPQFVDTNQTILLSSITDLVTTDNLPAGTEVRFALKIGATFYWYNGAAWAVSTGLFAEASDPQDFMDHGADIFADLSLPQPQTVTLRLWVDFNQDPAAYVSAASVDYEWNGQPQAINECLVFAFLNDILGNIPYDQSKPTKLQVGASDGFLHGSRMILPFSKDVTFDQNGYAQISVIETQTPGVPLRFSFSYYDGRSIKTVFLFNAIVPNLTTVSINAITSTLGSTDGQPGGIIGPPYVTPVSAGGTGITSYDKGDILYAPADNLLARLPIALQDRVLMSSGTLPEYGRIVDASVDPDAQVDRSKLADGAPNHVLINDTDGVMDSEAQLDIGRGGTGEDNAEDAFDALAPTSAKGQVIVHNGTNNVSLPPGSNGLVLGANSATATGLEYVAALVDPMTARGDLVTRNASNLTDRLPIGSSGTVLQSNGTDPQWTPVGVPTGSISAYAGTSAPTGWLICDGSQVSRATYAALYAVVGNAFGQGNGTTTFHLPDFRGRFLRGVNGIFGGDPDAATRSASNVGGNTGDNVGSLQPDAMQGHFHRFNTSSGALPSGSSWSRINPAGSNLIDDVVRELTTDGTNGTPRTTSETRPKNVYVYFIIKT